ncbi:hypothetical protein Q5752_004738 [Cryptotrichosporon argae]
MWAASSIPASRDLNSLTYSYFDHLHEVITQYAPKVYLLANPGGRDIASTEARERPEPSPTGPSAKKAKVAEQALEPSEASTFSSKLTVIASQTPAIATPPLSQQIARSGATNFVPAATRTRSLPTPSPTPLRDREGKLDPATSTSTSAGSGKTASDTLVELYSDTYARATRQHEADTATIARLQAEKARLEQARETEERVVRHLRARLEGRLKDEALARAAVGDLLAKLETKRVSPPAEKETLVELARRVQDALDRREEDEARDRANLIASLPRL